MGIDDYVTIKSEHDTSYHVGRILENYRDVGQRVEFAGADQQGLTKRLEEIYDEEVENNSTRLWAARWLDIGNRYFVAPADIGGAAVMAAGGPYAPLGAAVSFGARLISWIPKLLYGIYYTATTQDENLAIAAGAQEAYSLYAPAFGGVSYAAAPVYSNVAQSYVRRRVADRFREEQMTGRFAPNVTDISDILEAQRQQREDDQTRRQEDFDDSVASAFAEYDDLKDADAARRDRAA